MPRPRNRNVKVVCEVNEFVFQRLAVLAYNGGKSVDTFVRDLLEKGSDAAHPTLPTLPFGPPIVLPPAEASPAARAATEEAKKQKK